MAGISGGRARLRRAIIASIGVTTLLGGLAVWRIIGSGTDSAPVQEPSSVGLPRLTQTADRTEATPGGKVQGRVSGPSGEAIGGASVTALRQWRRVDSAASGSTPLPPPARTMTAADGTFTIELSQSGSYVIGAVARGRGSAFRSGLEVRNGSTVKGIDLKLTQNGVMLTGRLLDAGGGPIPGARVSATGVPTSQGLGFPANETALRMAFDATADTDGSYELRLPAARYSLEAQAGGYAPAFDWVDLDANETKDFRLEPAAQISWASRRWPGAAARGRRRGRSDQSTAPI